MAILLVAAAVLALYLLQNRLYRKFWQEGLFLDINFSAKEAFEGDSLYLQKTLVNKKILPLPWILSNFKISRNLIFDKDTAHISDMQNKSDIFSVMMYEKIGRKMPFVCGRRGFYRLRNAELVAGNLMHTQTFTKKLDFFTELTVFPRILSDYDELNIIYKALDAAMLSNSLINPDPFEFKGIREYQPTDPLRNVNFKASAVSGHLMVNIHAPTSAKSLEIILNAEYNNPYPNFELYEQAIRLAGTIADKYIGEDVKISFFSNGSDIFTGNQIKIFGGNNPAHLYSVLQALARINLLYKPAGIANYLETLEDNSAVYLIISPYYGNDFLLALDSLEARGLNYMAVIPAEDSTENITETNKIKIWKAL